MPRRRASKQGRPQERRLVIGVDRGTIMLALSLLSALGITGAGTLLNRGAVDEVKVGSDLQVQDTWSQARQHLVALAKAVKVLISKIEDLQRDNAAIKQAINQMRQQQGLRPLFEITDSKAHENFTVSEDLPQKIQFPRMDRVQAQLESEG